MRVVALLICCMQLLGGAAKCAPAETWRAKSSLYGLDSAAAQLPDGKTIVYASHSGGSLIVAALDATSGNTLWTFVPSLTPWSPDSSATPLLTVVDQGTIVAAFLITTKSSSPTLFSFFAACFNTANGAVRWRRQDFPVTATYRPPAFGLGAVALPALTAAGAFCADMLGNVTVLSVATGETMFSIAPTTDTESRRAGLDASRSLLITTANNKTAVSFTAFNTTSGNATWAVTSPRILNSWRFPATLSATTLYTVLGDPVLNSASIVGLRLLDGARVLEVESSSSEYLSTVDMLATPGGRSVVFRRDSLLGTSLTLVDVAAAQPSEVWAWSFPIKSSQETPSGFALAADGSAVFVGSATNCYSSDSNVAQLWAVATASGAATAVAAGSFCSLTPQASDAYGGGVIVASSTQLSSGSKSLAVSPLGAVTWQSDLYYVGQAGARVLLGTTGALAAGDLPAVCPAPGSAVPAAAIAGGVVGGVAVLGAAVAAAFYVQRRRTAAAAAEGAHLLGADRGSRPFRGSDKQPSAAATFMTAQTAP